MLTRDRVDSIVVGLIEKELYPAHIQLESNEDKYGCAPVRDAFIGEINPELKEQVENTMAGYIPIESYPLESKLENEIGAAGNMRLVLNKEVPVDKIRVGYAD